jgi:hypothetical protein
VIEFLASIDPVSLPLLAVLAFSVTLIPVGLMLGSLCSPCCQCSACVAGALPNTITVTLSGLPDTRPGPGLLSVSIQGCTGFGATAAARAPSGDDPPGPITAIDVTNGGSGYATINRVQPTVTADGPDGTGAELEVTLEETTDFCGIPYWEVTKVSVTKGGDDYTGGPAVFSVAEGDTELFSASAEVVTGSEEPTLQLEPLADRGSDAVLVPVLNQSGFDPDRWEIQSVTVTSGGTGHFDGDSLVVDPGPGGVEVSGAFLVIRNERVEPVLSIASQGGSDLEVVLASRGTTPATWEVSEVKINNGGSGYSDGQFLTLGLSGTRVVQQSSALLRARTIRDEPTLTATPSSGGTGAVISVAVSKTGSNPDIWSAASVTVTNPGSGYTDNDRWIIQASSGTTVSPGFADASVDQNGGLVSLAIDFAGQFFFDTGEIETVELVFGGGSYFDDTGVIDSVDVFFGGSYYQSTGEIVSVNVFSGGEYYRENPTGEPYLDNVTISVFGVEPGDGSGATFDAVIDDDPNSATFGQITGITVIDGGDGYLEFKNQQVCCGDFYNGRSIVLKRTNNDVLPGENRSGTNLPGVANPSAARCIYQHRFCGAGNRDGRRGVLRVQYNGPSSPASVELESEMLGTGSDDNPAQTCNVSLLAAENISDCSDFSFTATNDAGASATVEAGGEYDPGEGYAGGRSCFLCCKGTDIPPDEISVGWAADQSGIASGTYVLPYSALASGTSGNALVWTSFGLSVVLRICGAQTEDRLAFDPLTLPGGDVCDECHRKCITFARETRLVQSFGFSAFVTTTSLDGDPPTTCAACEETPICGPTPGAYQITDRGTMTIS